MAVGPDDEPGGGPVRFSLSLHIPSLWSSVIVGGARKRGGGEAALGLGGGSWDSMVLKAFGKVCNAAGSSEWKRTEQRGTLSALSNGCFSS
mmetsp:Transcript_12887/g.45299  ORF Transcript_12887/g.45299 Transcript_12887/m.45299 type:complete len:91 (+) Transcript_12887:990-1262(+)